MSNEFNYKEIIEIDTFYGDELTHPKFYQAKKQSTLIEHLDNYYNWMCLTIGTYNTYPDRLSDVLVKISELSKPYEHKVIDEIVYLRATFTLTFCFEKCQYEHPKWYRNNFYEDISAAYKSYLKGKTVFTGPPGEILNLSNGFEVSYPFVKHVNSQPI